MFSRLAAIETDLRRRLAEPQRHYHGQEHIDSLLALLETKRGDFNRPDAVELAIRFHDAVYLPGASDNERRSAALMLDMLDGIVDAGLVAVAEIMILATESHAVPSDLSPQIAADTALFLDFDMAILGAEPAAYDRYAQGVRHEFAPLVGDAAYRTGRAEFLARTLGAGKPIFQTAWGRIMEPAARANMERERAALLASSGQG